MAWDPRSVGSQVSFLDLISNALGAMLLLFFVVVSRQVSPPAQRVIGTLAVVVQSEPVTPTASLSVWMRPPQGKPRLFGRYIQALRWNSDDPGPFETELRSAGVSRQEISDLPVRSLYARDAARPNDARDSALALVSDPVEGCWELGVYYADDSGVLADTPLDVKVRVRVWFKGFWGARESANFEFDPRRGLPSESIGFAAPFELRSYWFRVTEDGLEVQTNSCAREALMGTAPGQ